MNAQFEFRPQNPSGLGDGRLLREARRFLDEHPQRAQAPRVERRTLYYGGMAALLFSAALSFLQMGAHFLALKADIPVWMGFCAAGLFCIGFAFILHASLAADDRKGNEKNGALTDERRRPAI